MTDPFSLKGRVPFIANSKGGQLSLNGVELGGKVHSFQVTFDGMQMWLTISVPVEVDLNLEVDSVAQVTDSVGARMSADDWDEVIANAGMGTGIGDLIVKHLAKPVETE